MSSINSKPHKTRTAQQPQRNNGKLRVAAILTAAADVIAENGYEVATMAKIAARSDTRIGSLYRFFPNKEVLANALMAGYRENFDVAFDKLDKKIASLSIPALADALLSIMLTLHKDGAAIIRLMDANADWSVKRQEFRGVALKRIAKTLMLSNPDLPSSLARDMAFVILHNMKAMKQFFIMTDKKTRSGAISELQEMTRLYLTSRLKNSR